MGDKSKIQWTDATWNPVRGCTRISPGCVNCYAERLAGDRLSGPGRPYEGFAKRTAGGPRWTGKVRVIDHLLDQPLRWTKPRRIFVNSMSDLFHERLAFEEIDRVFAVMLLSCRMADAATARMRCAPHVFQILTKRAERMEEWSKRPEIADRIAARVEELTTAQHAAVIKSYVEVRGAAHPRIWMGVSVEDRRRALERISRLLQTPAGVRWLSCEPLLERIYVAQRVLDWQIDTAFSVAHEEARRSLDWIVVGGESGPGCRPMKPEWAHKLLIDSRQLGAAFFMKQLGGCSNKRGRPEDLPEELRFREFPLVPVGEGP